MTNEQSRDAFEAWATQQAIERNYEYMSHLLTRHPETGDYNTTWVDSAWMGWKASRETLVVDFTPCNVQHASYNNCDCYAVSDVAVILGHHGLRFKA